MTLPVAIIVPDTVDTAPAGIPKTVTASLSTSTFGSGSSITAYQWYLDKPPESAAVLAGATSVSCSYVMDVPGVYQLRALVKNNLNVWSEGFVVRIDPSTDPYKFKAPDSAYCITRMAQALTLTVPPTSGARNVAADERALFFAVELLRRDIGTYAGTNKITRRISAIAGSAVADGSSSAPFNTTSAAAGGFNGPWDQALQSLQAYTTNPDAGYILEVEGGSYTEAVIIEPKVLYTIVPLAPYVQVTGNPFRVRFCADSDKLSLVTGVIVDGPGYFQIDSLTLKNPDQAFPVLWLSRAIIGNAGVTVESSVAGTPNVRFDDVFMSGPFNVPNAEFRELFRARIEDDFNAYSVWHARETSFGGDIAVTAAGSNIGYNGYYDCGFTGSAPTFTGPAGAAKFDAITARRFLGQAGTFLNFAQTNDFLSSDWLWRQAVLPVTITNIGTTKTYFVVSANRTQDVGVVAKMRIIVDAYVDLVLDAADSIRLELTAGAVGSLSLTAICTQAALIAGPVSTKVHLHSEVYILVTGGTGVAAMEWEYTAWSGGGYVDERDFGSDVAIDLDPAILRFNARVNPTGGSFGAASSAILRNLDIQIQGAPL